MSVFGYIILEDWLDAQGEESGQVNRLSPGFARDIRGDWNPQVHHSSFNLNFWNWNSNHSAASICFYPLAGFLDTGLHTERTKAILPEHPERQQQQDGIHTQNFVGEPLLKWGSDTRFIDNGYAVPSDQLSEVEITNRVLRNSSGLMLQFDNLATQEIGRALSDSGMIVRQGITTQYTRYDGSEKGRGGSEATGPSSVRTTKEAFTQQRIRRAAAACTGAERSITLKEPGAQYSM
ncbi:hypothetical protein BDW59DRAFT_165743 [Aspergillus cavernicola]|uniref:Uncharacterized protein n=1 Tax=Aspergillus cavernicola TaxID=176166 RepID=A0ABR4HR11_9EURO